MGAGQLQDLTLGDHPAGGGEDVQGPHRIGLDHQLEGAGEQEIPDQNAGGPAPDQVRRHLATAQRGRVHHIVMEQGRGVDELDGGGQLQRRIPSIAAQPRGGHGQQRTKALAAG